MTLQTTIPTRIWDAKKFHWKLYLQGKFDTISGCPNWLYEEIRQLKESGQTLSDIIYITSKGKHQYAVKLVDDTIQIYTKHI